MDLVKVLIIATIIGVFFRARAADAARAFTVKRAVLDAGGFFLGFSLVHDAAVYFLDYPQQMWVRYWACLAFVVGLAGRRAVEAWLSRRPPVGGAG